MPGEHPTMPATSSTIRAAAWRPIASKRAWSRRSGSSRSGTATGTSAFKRKSSNVHVFECHWNQGPCRLQVELTSLCALLKNDTPSICRNERRNDLRCQASSRKTLRGPSIYRHGTQTRSEAHNNNCKFSGIKVYFLAIPTIIFTFFCVTFHIAKIII